MEVEYTPSSEMRRAQLKVEPIEGDDYPAELIVFAFHGGAGTVEANLTRWQKLFKDEDGNPPKIESKKVQAKNVEVTRAETSGHYYPTAFPGAPERARSGLVPGFWASSSRVRSTAITSGWSAPTRR